MVSATLQSSNHSAHRQGFHKQVQCHLVSDVKFRPKRKMHFVLSKLSNRCLTARTTKLWESFIDSNDDSGIDEKICRLDEHLLSDCHYNPFHLVNMSDDDKFHFASFLHL